jgi:hypothetical protein
MTSTNYQGSVPDSVQPPRRPLRRMIALALIALLIAGLAWIWNPAGRYAQTGAAYGARVACSCRYLGGRNLADCHKDMEGAVGWVSLSEDPAAHSVTASYPLIAHQAAVYREGWGCQLQPWAK